MTKSEKLLQCIPKDQYVMVNNIKTRYWQAGNAGPVLVLIHGFAASVEDWIFNISQLAKKHRVYALDLVGFGRTDKPDINYTGSLLAKFVKDFMLTQNLDKTVIIGHSMGGSIALLFALEYKNMVEKLVLVSSGGFGRKIEFGLRLLTLPIIGDIMIRLINKNLLKLSRGRIVYNKSAIPDDLIDTFYAILKLPNIKKSLLSILRDHANIFGVKKEALKPILDNLAFITVPTLLIWGKQDPVVPIEQANFAEQHLPNTKLHIFDQCGHMPQMEYPELFNNLVEYFIACY